MQNIIKQKDFKYGFNPSACESCEGKCCSGESGYIWVNIEEMENIAKFLQISFDEFTFKYIKKVRYKYSLIEKRDGENYECIFFDSKSKKCTIYEVRPKQCRTFPFWDNFKKNIDEVVKECPGIIL